MERDPALRLPPRCRDAHYSRLKLAGSSPADEIVFSRFKRTGRADRSRLDTAVSGKKQCDFFLSSDTESLAPLPCIQSPGAAAVPSAEAGRDARTSADAEEEATALAPMGTALVTRYPFADT